MMFAGRRARHATEASGNIEFSAKPAPIARRSPGEIYDVLTCPLESCFFPISPEALRECFRVLKPGGRAGSSAGERKRQALRTTTTGRDHLKQRSAAPPPPPNTHGPDLSCSRGRRLRRARWRRLLQHMSARKSRIVVRTLGRINVRYWEQFRAKSPHPSRPLALTAHA